MAGVVLLVILKFTFISSQGLWCANPACSSCTQGFLYRSITCLSSCPSEHTISGTSCIPKSSVILFSLPPGIPANFNATAVGTFRHPQGLELRDKEKKSPIMTKDRGLYFANTSSLISNVSWVLAPRYRLCLSLRILKPGVIFQVFNLSYKILEISGTQTSFITRVVLSTLGQNKTETVSENHPDSWVTACFYCNQQLGFIDVATYTKSQYFYNSEFRSQIIGLNFSFGTPTGTSFTGFLYDGFLSNDVDFVKDLLFPEVNCAFNEYFFNRSCLLCDGNCSDWPWCVRESCNLCFYKECSQCGNYSFQPCSNCSIGSSVYCQLGFKCIAGSPFNCSECEVGYLNIKGICTIPPYKYDGNNLKNPVINTKFNSFQQFYDVFQSGNNSSTFSPFNNSESDDPIPIMSRGIAFINNRKSYLKSYVPVILSPEFTIVLWVYISENGLIFDKESVKILSNAKFIIEMVNYEERVIFNSVNFGTNRYNWKLYSIALKVESNMTSIYHKIDGTYYLANMIQEYAFSDRNTTIYIGNYLESSFYGFVYWVVIWQTFINDFSLVKEPCGITLGYSCLVYCSQHQYYNQVEKRCFDCVPNCNQGCSTFGKCGQCSINNCSVCSNYESNATCYNYSINYCHPSYKKGLDGNCCHTSCSLCYDSVSFKCFSCASGFYLLNTLCTSVCPLGYMVNSTKCIQVNTSLIDVRFDIISKNLTSVWFPVQFTVANTSGFYPNSSILNPIPAKNRGYYFSSKSSISTNPITLPYNITINIWIRSLTNGYIFKRGSLTISSIAYYIYGTHYFSRAVLFDWHILGVEIATKYNGDLIIKAMCNNQIEYRFASFGNSILFNINSPLVLGDPSASFVGFIYRMTIYNNVFYESPYSLSLSSCSFQSFEQNTICFNCSSSCLSGCINNNTCNLCSNPLCTECFNFSSSSCTKCENTSVLVNGECFCLKGTYWNQTTWKCEKCSFLCEACSNSSNCLSCMAGSYLSNDSCVCEIGRYYSPTLNNCSFCFNECLTCSGPLQIDCISCKSNAIILSNGSCSCSNGYYMESGNCFKCPGLCLTCTNKINCLTCKVNSSIVQGICKCQDELFEDYGLEICIKCNPQCYTCENISNQSCKSCKENSFLLNSSCYCNPRFYWDEFSSSCQSCQLLCLSCSSFSLCSLCKSNTKLINGICSCRDGFYLDNNLGECSDCHKECFNCQGPLRNHCESCKNHSVLQTDHTCKCLTGFYLEVGNCLVCSKYCLDCKTYQQCLICDELSYLEDGFCKCKESFFSDLNQDKCSPCHKKCLNCTSDTENSCTSCALNSSLIGNECLCNIGYFWDETVDKCEECEGLCLKCTSLELCELCNENSKINNGICICNDGYSRSTNECQKCNPECLTCRGLSRFECLTCKDFAVLQSDSSCKCIEHYYFDSLSLKCETCIEICKTCSISHSHCTSCFSKFFLSNNICNCIDGLYLNQTSCEPCHISCKTCNGPSEFDCLSCKSNSRLASNSACECLVNYFMKNGSCHSCYPACLTCTGETKQSCLACKDGLIIQESGTCKCADSLYWDNEFKACLPCSEFCLNCNTFNLTGCESCSPECFFCQDYSVYSNNSCRCIDGYFGVGNVCYKCHESCKTCFNEFYYSCSSCIHMLLAGLCIDKCPLGYFNKNGICIMKGNQGEVMKFEFNHYALNYTDSVSGLYLCQPQDPIINISFPVPAYGQGLYFNGVNAGLQLSNHKGSILSDEFIITFWINLLDIIGNLIRSSDPETQSSEFSLSYNQIGVNLIVVLGTLSFQIQSNQSIPIKEWIYIGVSISHNSPTSASLLVNSDISRFSNISEEPFQGYKSSETNIGFDSQQQLFFNGFLYKLELKRNSSLHNITPRSCSGCLLCSSNNECLNPCSFYEYFDKSSKKCRDCLPECKSGCRHKSTCGMCFESTCLECFDFEYGSCTDCIPGYQVFEGKCQKCEGTVYYNTTSKLCEKCKGLCVTCLTEIKCLTCELNSEIQNDTCACSLGYYLNISICERVLFHALIKIQLDNSVYIVFSEPLSHSLTKEDIQVFYNTLLCDYQIDQIDNSTYSVYCKITWNVRPGSSIHIEFIRPINSTFNSLLETKNLSIGLFPSEIGTFTAKIEKAQKYAGQGTSIGSGISLCISVASFDISSLFNFVNFAEIFSIISLYELDLKEDILEFLRSVRVQKSLPNVFNRFRDDKLHIELKKEFSKYGYKSNSAIINSGPSILIFLIIVFCFLVVRIMIPFYADKFPKLLLVYEYFHYGIFLKYWLQTSLDLLTTSVYSIFYGYFDSLFYFCDYCCSAIIIVIIK